uniref:Uncharacterized protein n=1 Tax=viral metagenome TaxID=1070528 RepID=A0A6M3KAS0_9ZZZZ
MPEIGKVKRAKELGLSGWNKWLWHACEVCGKERWTRLIKGEPEYSQCKACGHKGKLNGRWNGGKVQRICPECEETFLVKPSKLKHNRGKYCSRSCELIHLRKQGYFRQSPNKIEQTLIDLFTQHNLPFKYVGDGEVWFGNRNPDFLNTDGKKQVIEILGTYWHPLFDGADRIEHYKGYGFTCLAIWEDELVDPYKVLGKIKRFAKREVYAFTR